MKQDYINSSTILNCNSLSSIYDLEVGGSVIASNAIIIFVDIWSSLYSLQTQVNGKQETLSAGTNITIDENNITSSIGGGSDITQADLDLKQDILQAGKNITISNNIISSTGWINQADLDLKHDILTYNNDLILNSIKVKQKFTKGIYTEALDGEIRASILSIEDHFIGETLNF